MTFKFRFRGSLEQKPAYLFSSKMLGSLCSILVLSMTLIIAGCGVHYPSSPRSATPERGPEIVKPAAYQGICITELQCEKSKTEFLDSCAKESAREFESCKIRLKAKFKSCCEKAGYSPEAIAAEDCSSCKQFNENGLKQNRWLYCHRSECNWPVDCKTADNIVAPNDRDALWSCCEAQGAKERTRCDKEMANKDECERIERLAVNACMTESPASKAAAYTERSPKPFQPSAQPSSVPGATPGVNSQFRE